MSLTALAAKKSTLQTFTVGSTINCSEQPESGEYSDSVYKVTPDGKDELTVTFHDITFENIISGDYGTAAYGDCVYIENKHNKKLTVNFENCKFSGCGKYTFDEWKWGIYDACS